jgi:hypothetical protein
LVDKKTVISNATAIIGKIQLFLMQGFSFELLKICALELLPGLESNALRISNHVAVKKSLMFERSEF